MEECAFPFLELQHPTKGLLKVPYRQYVLNKEQQFAVIAIDFSYGVELGEHDGIEYKQMGKLAQQNLIFNRRIINSLTIEEWDFDNYPNPEIVLMTTVKNI